MSSREDAVRAASTRSSATAAQEKRGKEVGLPAAAVEAIIEDAPVAILLHVNEQKIHHKYVKGFQMIPAGLIDMHRVWLDRG